MIQKDALSCGCEIPTVVLCRVPSIDHAEKTVYSIEQFLKGRVFR